MLGQEVNLIVAVRNRLVAETDLTVYDGTAPQDAPMPYTVIADTLLNENGTDTTTGFDGTIAIHHWAHSEDRVAVSQMMQQTYDALHRQEDNVSMPGLIGIHEDNRLAVVDPTDITQRTWHGVQYFRFEFDNT